MEFKPLTLREVGTVRPLFQTLKSRTCDYSVGSMFMWREFFRIEFALEDGALFSRIYGEKNDVYYYLPVSDDVEGALHRLIDSGAALRKLDDFVKATQEAAK